MYQEAPRPPPDHRAKIEVELLVPLELCDRGRQPAAREEATDLYREVLSIGGVDALLRRKERIKVDAGLESDRATYSFAREGPLPRLIGFGEIEPHVHRAFQLAPETLTDLSHPDDRSPIECRRRRVTGYDDLSRLSWGF